MSWDERRHPRDDAGRFTSRLHWRVFPSGLAPGLVPGDDPLNATQQVRRSEEDFHGLGSWWFASGDMEHNTDEQARQGAEHYGASGSVLVGVRFDPRDVARFRERSDSSGLIAPQGTGLLVEQMSVWPEGGTGWQPVEVPPGLTSYTKRDPDWAERVSARLGEKQP